MTTETLESLNRTMGALLNVRRCQKGQKAAATQRKIEAIYAQILAMESGHPAPCTSESSDYPGLTCHATAGHEGQHMALGHRWSVTA